IDFYVNNGTTANNTVTSGSTHVMSLNAGNVGVGVTSPAQKLHVVGNARITGLSAGGNVQANASGDLIISNDIVGGDADYIQNQFAAAQAANYWISGNARIQGNTFIGPNANKYFYPSGDRIIVAAESTTDVAEFASYGLYLPKTNAYNLYVGGGAQLAYGTAGYLDFRNEGGISTNSGTLNMYFKNSGFVGVGTTNPLAKFHVYGGGQLIGTTGTSSTTRTLTIHDASTAQINFGSYPGAWTSALQIQNNDNSDYIWLSPLQDGNHARLLTFGSGLDFYVGNNIHGATLTETGSFGIGYTAPSYKLHVNGSAGLGQTYLQNSDLYFTNTGHAHTGIGNTAGYAAIENASSHNTLMILGRSGGIGGGRSVSIWDRLDINGTLYVTSLDQNANRIVMADANGMLYTTGSIAGTGLGDNLGNHTATTTLNMNYNHITNIADLYSVNNYGQGLVGVYASTRYQNVFSMGTSWRLASNGTTPGNMYGLSWTHSNVGGQSIGGLGHQLLVMTNGATTTAIGNGVWTPYTSYFPFIYDQQNTGYYWDGNGTSRSNVEISNENYTYGWFRNYNAMQGLYNQATGSHFYSQDGDYWVSDSNRGIQFRDGHNGPVQGYTYYDDSGNFGLLSPGGSWRFRCDNTNTEAYGSGFYAPTTYTSFIYDRGNTGYYLNLDGVSQMHYVLANNWFRPQGATGIYWENYGGGWWMQDATWLRTYNNKPILASGGVAGYGSVFGAPFNMYPRIYANYDNAGGGGLMVSDDGGFCDYNDAWIQFRGSNGLDIRSNNGSWNVVFRMGNQDNSGTSDKRVATGSNAWGLLGASGNAWWQTWAYSFNNASDRNLKRDIVSITDDVSDLVMADLDKLNPYFYKYKVEEDEWIEGKETKFRPALRIGLMADEVPDYVAGPDFKSVDVYGVASLAVAAAKHNREEINEIKDAIGFERKSKTVTDFGTASYVGPGVWVDYSPDFKNAISTNQKPVITLTSSKPGTQLYVIEKAVNGFRVVAEGDVAGGFDFDYYVVCKVVSAERHMKENVKVTPELLQAIRVSESDKARIQEYWSSASEKQAAIEEQARIDAVAIQKQREAEVGSQVGDPALEGSKEAQRIHNQLPKPQENVVVVEENDITPGNIEGVVGRSGDAEVPSEDIDPSKAMSVTGDGPVNFDRSVPADDPTPQGADDEKQ
ncbi:MAG: hypothetical protein RL266_970, partial [Bacteroidota bacterium]